MCSELITLPLKIIFRESLKKRKYSQMWKKANAVPVHKKEDKTFIVNYRSISLLPIFDKISERLIYNSLFSYFLILIFSRKSNASNLTYLSVKFNNALTQHY